MVFTLSSLDGGSRATISTGGADGAADNGAPVYRVEFGGRAVTQDASMGILADGVSFGAGSEVVSSGTARVVEKFPTRGNHREACVAFNQLSISLKDRASGRDWRIEARMSDDAFAWRYIVPRGASDSSGTRVFGETSEFRPLQDCTVWLAERPNDWKLKSYAGFWMRAAWKDLPRVSKAGPVQCPPLVAELPAGGGWLVFTEAGLRNYSGMRLRAEERPDGDVSAHADFTEGADGFLVAGDAVSPWRVVRFAKTLDALINTGDLLEALSAPPDKTLFADAASWVRGGRAAWHWWSKRRAGTPAEEMQMMESAAKLGFEYSLVDEGWLDWDDPWARVRELTAAGRKQNVGIFLWRHMKDMMNPENEYADLRAYFDTLAGAGVAGVKIDFFNAESKAMVDLQQAIMREAAKRKLLVLLHGCQKPTGETRTWPNQLSREGIRGLELNGMAEGPITAEHDCALPFTRLAIGPGDYTPVGFSAPGATTWAHQLATAVVFLSPLQVIAEYPPMLLDDARCAPALDLIKALPVEWDETRVLAPSEIGECAILARRHGDEWWVGALNARPMKIETLDLGFLNDGAYEVVIITNDARAEHPLRRTGLARVTRDSVITLDLARSDGAALRFLPIKK
ncbi:MAG: glycoside hydrolase family 97 protein [Opitutaceae bacterium]|jgi:alpha-glucosidase|nr:glycoside hydrolase family 97 protein [Opitutaceae bacterium]